jgi:ribonuclease HI
VKATISSERKAAIEAETKDKADYKIYTDGSEHNGRVGASATILRKGTPRAERSLTYHLGNSSKYTIADAELVGALLGIWLLRTTPGSARSTFSLYTDSQTVVRHLTKQYAGPGSHIVNAFRGYVDRALEINWIPGHSDIPGNTEADDLAHLAARGQSSPINSLPPLLRRPLPLSIEAERRNYGQEINTMWRERWQQSPRRERMERMDKSFPFTKFRQLLRGFTRGQCSLLIQIRSGHIPLNAHLFRLSCADTDKCQACHNRPGAPSRETVTHFLFDCPAYQNERHHLDTALGCQNRDLGYIMSKESHIRELLRYIARTERLQKTFGNVTPHFIEDPTP